MLANIFSFHIVVSSGSPPPEAGLSQLAVVSIAGSSRSRQLSCRQLELVTAPDTENWGSSLHYEIRIPNLAWVYVFILPRNPYVSEVLNPKS